MLGFFKRRNREQITSEPFPAHWLGYLRRNVSYYAVLSPDERLQLQDDLRIFRSEKHWEGAGGLALTDEITVTIAAQASLLTLHLPERDDYFHGVSSIIVYPAGYKVTVTRPSGPAGVVEERADRRLGEAWQSGPVILSWADARAGGRGETRGSNVVLHEFAHQLDMEDGAVEGTPRLYSTEQYEEWHRVMNASYDRLRARLWWRYRNLDTDLVLDAYGATNAAEFFAVATETFFERPRALHRQWADLYYVLRDYYRQDPAARVLRHLRATARAARPMWLGD